MNIRENFQNKLQQLREDTKQLDELSKGKLGSYIKKAVTGMDEDYDPVKKKEAEDDEWSSKKLKPKTSGAAKYFKNYSKKLKKQAVTGMDENLEARADWMPSKPVKKVKAEPGSVRRSGSVPGTSIKHYTGTNSKGKEKMFRFKKHAHEFAKGIMKTVKEEQIDDTKKSNKLFLRSKKMISTSKLDRNRERNKDNRQD